jgi:hypothetical protein
MNHDIVRMGCIYLGFITSTHVVSVHREMGNGLRVGQQEMSIGLSSSTMNMNRTWAITRLPRDSDGWFFPGLLGLHGHENTKFESSKGGESGYYCCTASHKIPFMLKRHEDNKYLFFSNC